MAGEGLEPTRPEGHEHLKLGFLALKARTSANSVIRPYSDYSTKEKDRNYFLERSFVHSTKDPKRGCFFEHFASG